MKKGANKGKLLILLSLILACTLFLTGDGALPGSPLSGFGGAAPLFFGQTDTGLYLVLAEGEGARVYYLEQADLQAGPSSTLLERVPDSLSIRGGKLNLLTNSSGFQSQMALGPDLDIYTAQGEGNFYFSPWEPGCLFADPAGGPLYLAGPDGRLLAYYPSEPDSAETGLDQVEFLEATPGGWVYSYSQGTLHRWQGELHEEYSSLCPARLIGEDAFLDVGGAVCLLADGQVRQVMNMDAPSPFLCFDGTYILTADATGTVRQYDQNGEAAGSYSLSGTVWGLTPGFILAELSGELWVQPHSFQASPSPEPSVSPEPSASPEPSPSPEPSASPEPSPSPEPSASPEPSFTPKPSPSASPASDSFKEQVEIKGKWLYVPSGGSVQQLRELFQPESVLVYNLQGETVFEGRLTTGMTVKAYTVVLPGDCDCSGTVDNQDVFAAQNYILGVNGFWSTARILAGDMNGDGEVTVSDLVLISLLADGYS